MTNSTTYTAFEGHKILAQGSFAQVILKIKKHLGKEAHSSVLIFSDDTGKTMDFNFQGSEQDVQKRLEVFMDQPLDKDASGPGRPKLGVVSREVSLLPRHWEWLASQPGGASATLRKLIETAKKKSEDGQSDKQVQERTYRFMSALAGDLTGYEEALRALYKKDHKVFFAQTQSWPKDIRNFAHALSQSIFE